MLTPRKLWRRIKSLFIRPRLDRELDDELRFHLDMETTQNRQAGLDEVAAGRRARLGAAMVLGVAALAATWFPASRAARTDPVDALRFD